MNEAKQVQLNPLVVLDQTARLADIDREAWRNHIMLMAQREYDLTIQNARQAEEIGRLRKAVEAALLLPIEATDEAPELAAARQKVKSALPSAAAGGAALGAPADEPPATPAPPTEAEQLEAMRKHAMGED